MPQALFVFGEQGRGEGQGLPALTACVCGQDRTGMMPDTGSYLFLGLAAAFGILGAYVLSLAVRLRRRG